MQTTLSRVRTFALHTIPKIVSRKRFNGCLTSCKPLKQALRKLLALSNSIEGTGCDIHDGLRAYYEIAQPWFVDEVCRQSVDHFLLLGPGSPLTVLCERLILGMTPEELEEVAGEDSESRDRRESLATRQGA